MDEFMIHLQKREKELKKIFDDIDTNHDGEINLQDLKYARDHGRVFQNASDDELEAILDWMDTLENAFHDGKIHFEEFTTAMILLPPSFDLKQLLSHFRQEGTPERLSNLPLGSTVKTTKETEATFKPTNKFGSPNLNPSIQPSASDMVFINYFDSI